MTMRLLSHRCRSVTLRSLAAIITVCFLSAFNQVFLVGYPFGEGDMRRLSAARLISRNKAKTSVRFMGGVQMPNFQGKEKKAAVQRFQAAKLLLEDAQALLEANPEVVFYQVTTDSADGIGIRETPELGGARMGDDVTRGTIFAVTEVIEQEGNPTFLKLADGRGWVFDTSPIDPEHPSALPVSFEEIEEAVSKARTQLDAVRGARLLTDDEK